MGFFDSIDYSAANDVDSFTRSVHSLLSDLYQSNPLQSGTLDKVVSVPDLKPLDVPAGLSAPQQSGLLSSYSPTAPTVSAPVVSTPSISSPTTPSLLAPTAVPAAPATSVPSPLVAPVVDSSAVTAPTVAAPLSPLQLLMQAKVKDLKKYNPAAAAQVEDPSTMVVPTQAELLAAYDAKTAAEDQYIEAQKQAMQEGEEIAKERYQPNWLIVAGALAVGGKKGAAALAGYLKVSQSRFQQDQAARLQVLKDVAEASKLTAIQAGRPYERLTVAMNIAVDSNNYLKDLIDVSAKQLSPTLQAALAKSSQNYTLTTIKSGGFILDPAAFIDQEVANAAIPDDSREAYRELLSYWFVGTFNDTQKQIQSAYLHERYSAQQQKEKVTTSPFANRLVQEDTFSPGALYPEVDKVMAAVGTADALRFLPPKDLDLAVRSDISTALQSAQFGELIKKGSWRSEGNMGPGNVWMPLVKSLLQDPEFLANPQGFDILKRYPVKGVTPEAAKAGAEQVRSALTPIAMAASPVMDQMARSASTQLAPVSAGFREIREKAIIGYTKLLELAVMPEVRSYARPELLSLLSKSSISDIARSMADTVLATKDLSGSAASRAILGTIFGANVGIVADLIDKSDGSRDAGAASLLRSRFKEAATASYSLARVSQINTAAIEAAYGQDLSRYFLTVSLGSPTHPVEGYGVELAKYVAVGASRSVQKGSQIGQYIADPGIKSLFDAGLKEYNVEVDNGTGGDVTPFNGGEGADLPGKLAEAISSHNNTKEKKDVAIRAGRAAWAELLRISDNGKKFDPRYIMAQLMHESGYLSADDSPYDTANNGFGITIPKGGLTKEHIARLAAQGVNVVGSTLRPSREGGAYYKYATIEDSVRHRLLLASPGRSQAALGVEADSPEAFAQKAYETSYFVPDTRGMSEEQKAEKIKKSIDDYKRAMRKAFVAMGATPLDATPPARSVEGAQAPVKQPEKPAPEKAVAPVKEQAKPVKVVTAKDVDVKPVLQQVMNANVQILAGTGTDTVTKYMDAVTKELRKRGLQLDTTLYNAILKKATDEARLSVAKRGSSRS